MTPACTTCRFNRPEFVDNGLNCRKYKEHTNG